MATKELKVNERGWPIGSQHPRARHTDSVLAEIRRLADLGVSYAGIELATGVPRSTVRDILKGRIRGQEAAQTVRKLAPLQQRAQKPRTALLEAVWHPRRAKG